MDTLLGPVSIVLTIHNKEQLISKVVDSILRCMSNHVSELIVVFDGCTDRSEYFFEEALKKRKLRTLNVIRHYADNVWETKANNIGLRSATGKYVCIIQDDMIVKEKSFDQRLIKPLIKFEDCFAVTGRTAHNVTFDKSKSSLEWTSLVGRDNPVENSVLLQFDTTFFRKLARKVGIYDPKKYIFSIRDVVNRGPLMFDADRLNRLGFLDEHFQPLTLDDHDLCFRAYKQYGWICGSYYMKYLSDDSWGGTRRNDTVRKIVQDAEEKNKKILIERY